jgi:hypothetical protein
MLIDGGRTTFLPIALLTFFMLNDLSIDKRRIRKVYLAAVLGVVASIAARAEIIKSSSLLVRMTIPVTVEGTMGAYSSLQSIYAAEVHPNAKYTYGASYVVDPLVWFLPTVYLFFRNGLTIFRPRYPKHFHRWAAFTICRRRSALSIFSVRQLLLRSILLRWSGWSDAKISIAFYTSYGRLPLDSSL